MSNASCGYQLFGVWDAFWWGWFLRGCPTPGREAGVPRQLQGPGAPQKEVRGGELEPAVTTAAQICPAQERQQGPGLMSGEEAVLWKALGWGSSNHRFRDNRNCTHCGAISRGLLPFRVQLRLPRFPSPPRFQAPSSSRAAARDLGGSDSLRRVSDRPSRFKTRCPSRPESYLSWKRKP